MLNSALCVVKLELLEGSRTHKSSAVNLHLISVSDSALMAAAAAGPFFARADDATLEVVPGLRYHGYNTGLRFDASRMAVGLAVDFAAQGRTVEQINSAGSHKAVFLNQGFTTGRHLVQFKVIQGGPKNYVMIASQMVFAR